MLLYSCKTSVQQSHYTLNSPFVRWLLATFVVPAFDPANARFPKLHGAGNVAVDLAGCSRSGKRLLVDRDYLLGFSALEREVEIGRVPVEGEVPGWLSGTLIRNGPGTWDAGEKKLRH